MSDNEESGRHEARLNEHIAVLRNNDLPLHMPNWLDIPDGFTNPPLMCCTSEFVRLVTDNAYNKSSGPELVLFAHGGTSMPEHFKLMVECVAIINRSYKMLNGYAVATPNSRLVKRMNGKKCEIIGIEKKMYTGALPQGVQYENNFIQTVNPITTTNSMFMAQLAETEIYVRQEMCTLEWGVLPYRYNGADGVEVRDVFQTLRVISAPGLNLVKFVHNMLCESSKGNRQADKEYDEAHRLLLRVLDQEMVNLDAGIIHIPDPLSVSNSMCPSSMVSLLSPFMILRKMLKYFAGGYCGTAQQCPGLQQDSLIVYGMPALNSPANASAAIESFDAKHRAYLEAVNLWCVAVDIKCNSSGDEETVEYSSLLSTEAESYSPIRSAITMIFYTHFKDTKEFSIKRISFPLIVGTILTNFKFVVRPSEDVRWMEIRNGYIMAQCGSDKTVLNGVKLHQQYKTAGRVDYPQAGMYVNMRRAMESLLQKQCFDEDSDTLVQFLSYCHTILMEQQLDGFFMSERVRNCAEMLKRCKDDICPNVSTAVLSFEHDMCLPEHEILQRIIHDDMMHTEFLMRRGLCVMNKTTKATTINLGLVYACLISDVLCFLGMDNATWTWCFFPILVCGGAGHLRAQTEDGHSQRTECVYLAKASSVGFNAVVVSTTNSILSLVTKIFPDLRTDVVNLLRMMKLDRITRVAIEERSAVISVNGSVISVPDPNVFMGLSVFDELARNASHEAIDGLVTSGFPRDKAGGGTTQKSAESRTRGPRERQDTTILRGMSLFSPIQAQNRNCSNTMHAESMKALISGAVACFPPSAQPSKGFCILDEQKSIRSHNCSSYDTCNAMGESQMPNDAAKVLNLAWAYCMLPMNCRAIGLLNKMSMSNVVVNQVEQQLYKWFGNFVLNYFKPFLGSTLLLSFWRIMNGYLSRSIASTMISMNALHMTQYENVEMANVDTMLNMECGLGLHGLNNALLDSLSHLLDFNLIIVNQIIAHKLDTPVLSFEFMKALVNNRYERNGAEFKTLKLWLMKYVNNNETKLQHQYVLVPELGTKRDYRFYEQYLEVYCSIVPDSFYTYWKAVMECVRVIDLSDFLGVGQSILSFNYDLLNLAQQGFNAGESDLRDVQQTFVHIVRKEDKNEKMYVHLMQHVIITSMLGRPPLHSDNIYLMGRRLFKCIMENVGVQQQVPNGVLCHSFDQVHGSIIPAYVRIKADRLYMTRSTIDIGGWTNGKTEELNGLLGPHPFEDIMHMGSWIQMHSTLGREEITKFEYKPFPALRTPELAKNRFYPMFSPEYGYGTVCISPGGRNYVRITLSDYQTMSVNLLCWSVPILSEKRFQIGPCIFRHSAVIRHNGRLGLIVKQKRNDCHDNFVGWKSCYDEEVAPDIDFCYMNHKGMYKVAWSDGTRESVFWVQVHDWLLGLGTRMFVRPRSDMGLPRANVEFVRGWLRYSEEFETEEDVYVCFRISSDGISFESGKTMQFSMNEVFLEIDSDNVVDYLHS